MVTIRNAGIAALGFIMFKIDYFDQNLSMHSPDPADPTATQRVITIMLAEEY